MAAKSYSHFEQRKSTAPKKHTDNKAQSGMVGSKGSVKVKSGFDNAKLPGKSQPSRNKWGVKDVPTSLPRKGL